MRILEESRPWAKTILAFKDQLPGGNEFNYFEKLWSEYQAHDYFWCIYRKDGQFCGDVQLDRDSDTEYHLYIQIMDDARIEGCRTDFADIQNKKECGGNRQWQNHYLRNWAANTKGKGII